VKIALDVVQNILQQFRRIFDAPDLGGASSLEMSPEVGSGRIDLVVFPGQLELYHYWSTPKPQLEFTTSNPEGSRWYGLQVNLADAEVVRRVGATEVSIQRLLPSGMLLYPPGASVSGVSQPHQRPESVFIRFHRDFLAE